MYSHLNKAPEAEEPAIVQFSSPLYFATEDEGVIKVDVMRLGSRKGCISCSYHTEDSSGKDGERYEASEGIILFADGEIQQSICINILDVPTWCATLEFKIHLTDPEGCGLSSNLHTCRVKVIDDTRFPSDKYPEVAQGQEAIASLGTFALFGEYVKMNFCGNGIGWRTLLCLLLDQSKNAYLIYRLCATSYMLNTIFDDVEEDTSFTIEQRTQQARIIGLWYILPMFILHACDVARVHIDIHGRSLCFLQQNILRKYLNFNEASRDEVTSTDLQMAVREDAEEMADGYMSTVSMVQLVGKIAIVMSFTFSENPKALPYAIVMAALMLVFGCLRYNSVYAAGEKVEALDSDINAFLADVCNNYELIADYWQRPKINDIFAKKSSSCRQARIHPNVVSTNNDYFTRWLGPVFMGLYIIAKAPEILTGDLGKGTFIATLSVFSEISSGFSEGLSHMMKISSKAMHLRDITFMLNLSTDLPEWKAVNRARRAISQAMREEMMHSSGSFPTDLMNISFKNVGFWFDEDTWVLHDASFTVPQGSMVAIFGKHGDGRQNLLKLIAHKVFPTVGQVFVPSHLRILHVSQVPYILHDSLLNNLCFGVHKPDMGIIIEILQLLRADKLITELRNSERFQDESSSDSETEHLIGACCSEEAGIEPERFDWMKKFSYTEKVKVHLARAFIMNPQVLALQRPLLHFREEDKRIVLELLRQHVTEKGLGQPREKLSSRRPRTAFLSVESAEQAGHADIVLQMQSSVNEGVRSATVTMAKAGRHEPLNELPRGGDNPKPPIHF